MGDFFRTALGREDIVKYYTVGWRARYGPNGGKGLREKRSLRPPKWQLFYLRYLLCGVDKEKNRLILICKINPRW